MEGRLITNYVSLHTVIDEKKCVFCLNCILSCPVEVIDADYTKRKAVVTNQVECIACLNCEEVCPAKAIKVKGIIRKKWKIPPIQFDIWGIYLHRPENEEHTNS